jgi:hypothetical protein
MKFMAITKTHTIKSGWNKNDYHKSCQSIFLARHKENIDNYYLSYSYLKDKPKWKSFGDKDEENAMARPIGKKAATKLQKTETIVKMAVENIMKENNSNTTPTTVDVMDPSSSESSSQSTAATELTEQVKVLVDQDRVHKEKTVWLQYIMLLPNDEKNIELAKWRNELIKK